MFNKQRVCDFCHEVVDGIDRGKVIKEDYIFLNGKMAIEFWNKETDRREFFYVTKDEEERLIFCNLKCLSGYIEKRREDWYGVRENVLGNSEPDYDDFGDYEPPVTTKKQPRYRRS